MFFNKNKQEAISPEVADFVSRLDPIEKGSVERVGLLESLIIRLEKEIMDVNESDAENEAHRKNLRPLTNDLMNHMKIDRNLNKLMLQEIAVARKEGAFKLTQRFADRFLKVVTELQTVQDGLVALAIQFKDASPGILDQYIQVTAPK